MDNILFLMMHWVIPKKITKHRIFGRKQNKSINTIIYLIVHNTNRELSSLTRLYKSHMNSRNKQKSPDSKKVETTYSGLEYKRERLHVFAAEEWPTMSAILKFCLWKRQIPRFTLSCDQKDLWHGRVPQTPVTWEIILFGHLTMASVCLRT